MSPMDWEPQAQLTADAENLPRTSPSCLVYRQTLMQLRLLVQWNRRHS